MRASIAGTICPTGAMKNKREKTDTLFESSGDDLRESLLEVQCTYMYICNCNNGSEVWVCSYVVPQRPLDRGRNSV